MGDLIRRQDAIKAVANYLWHYPNDQYKNLNVFEIGESLVKDALSIVPSADRPKDEVYNYLKERIGDIVDDMKEFDAWFERMVWHVKECDRIAKSADRPTGEWKEKIIKGDSVWTQHRYYCSVCGGWNTYGKSDYCPNCGAKMGGESE